MFRFGNLARQKFVESTKIDPEGENNVFLLRATVDDDWPKTTNENLEYLNNAVPTTNSPYCKNWSFYFDGVDDYLTYSSNFALGSDDFTIEFFCRFNNAAIDVIDRRILSQTNQLVTGFQVYVSSSDVSITGETTVTGGIIFANNVPIIGTIDAVNDDEWHHIVFQRVGTTVTSYIDGVLKQTVTTVTDLSSNTGIRIGSDFTTATSGNYEGWLCNIRINTVNVAYPTEVLVPTEPLISTADTKFLACKLPHWDYEASSNKFSGSVSGAFLVIDGPFDDSDENYISMCSNVSTNSILKTIDDAKWELSGGDYTVEGWIWPYESASGSTAEAIAVWGPGGYSILWQKSGYWGGWAHFQSSFYTRTAIGYNAQNNWQHFVINRNAGTISVRFNGVHYGGATTANRNWGNYIGFGTVNVGVAIADVRVTKGESLFPNAATTYDLPEEPIPVDFRNPTDTNNVLMLGIDPNAIRAGRSFFNRGKAKHMTFHAYPSTGPKPTQINPFTSANYYMLRLGGSNIAYLSESAAFRIDAGQPFTWEMWVYMENTTTGNIMQQAPYSTAYNDDIAIVWGFSSAVIRTGNAGTNSGTNRTLLYPGGVTISTNQWNHVAIVRDENDDARLFLNGVPGAAVACPGHIRTNCTRTDLTGSPLISFGKNAYVNWTGGTHSFATGYICNARLIKGRALYTGAFVTPKFNETIKTPDTNFLGFSATSSVTNDLSDNAATITYNSGTSLQSILQFTYPFIKKSTFNPGRNGGSVILRTNQYLRAQGNGIPVGFRDFTIECWIYSFSWSNGNRTIFDGRPAGVNGFYPLIYVRQASGIVDQLFYHSNSATRISGPTLLINRWYHLAVTRTNGVTRMFVDGQQVGSDYPDNNEYPPIARPYIGADAGVNVWNGYISNFRFCVGESLYPGNFPVPTFAPTKTEKTQILLTFDNNNIDDISNNNSILQSSDADTKMRVTNDPAIKKFTGAITFNGVDDFIIVPHLNSQTQKLGLDNFTIEIWYYIAAGDMTTNRGLIGKGDASNGWSIQLDNTGKVIFYYGTNTITSVNSTTPNSWNHVAIVRSGLENAQTRLYLNGLLEGTGLVDTDFNQTNDMRIGTDRVGSLFFKGYIDSIRITPRVVRYTGLSFQVPQEPFPER